MKKRIWLITGISSGIGKALSEEVMSSGDYVIGTLRREEQVLAYNHNYKGQGQAYLLDIRNHDHIDQIISKINIEYGRIDILVNNAGIGFAGGVEESSISEMRDVMEVNFYGPVKLTQAVLPIMRVQQSGHIVQISSHAGVKAFAGFGIYNASKFALEGISEALAQEIEPMGIRTTIVEPGPFRTEFASQSLGLSNQQIEDYQNTAGAFRSKLLGVHKQQEGHPQKAAKVIIDHINDPNSSLRLPLGSIPLKTIQMKIDSLQTDLEVNKEKALSATY